MLLDMTSWWCHRGAHGHHAVPRQPPPRPGRRRRGRRPRDPAGRRAPRLRPRPRRPAGADGGHLPGRRRDHRRDAGRRRRRPAQRPRPRLRGAGRARRAAPAPPAARPAGAPRRSTRTAAVARITLRIPESVKARAEELAAALGPLAQHLAGQRGPRPPPASSAVNVDIDLSSIPFFGGNDPFGGGPARQPPHDRLGLTPGPPPTSPHPGPARQAGPADEHTLEQDHDRAPLRDPPARRACTSRSARAPSRVDATDTTETHVEVTGRDADQVARRAGRRPDQRRRARARAGFLGGDSRLDVRSPSRTDSDAGRQAPAAPTSTSTARVGDRPGQQRLRRRPARRRSAGPALVETGSGDIRVDDARAELRIKSGSGDVSVGQRRPARSPSRPAPATSRSAPPAARPSSRPAPATCRSPSAHDDVSLTTGSGDLVVGAGPARPGHRQGRLRRRPGRHPGRRPGVDRRLHRVRARSAPTSRAPASPRRAQDHVEVRAKTVSGDIVLTEV